MTYAELQALNDKAYAASELIKELSQLLGAYFANLANRETRIAELEAENEQISHWARGLEASSTRAIQDGIKSSMRAEELSAERDRLRAVVEAARENLAEQLGDIAMSFFLPEQAEQKSWDFQRRAIIAKFAAALDARKEN
jgi:hypothetical protein